MFKVAVGDLQDILKIDKTNLLVTVQPGVTIGLLNRLLYLTTLISELKVLAIEINSKVEQY